MSRVLAIAAMAIGMLVATMFVHELGHVLGAIATGGLVVSVEIRPGRIGHTLVNPNPAPSVVLWSGFLFGWFAPMATRPAWGVQRGLIGPALRAAAWFSWLAFGSYLALAGRERLTDTGQLFANGWPLTLLMVVGAAVAVVGYVFSRDAWATINERLERHPATWRQALGWWLTLTGWCVLQSGIA